MIGGIMNKILLISIGTGIGVENGIKVSIESHKPDYIFFFCTERSIETVQNRIFGLYDHKFPYGYKIVKISDANNHEAIYRKTANIIYNLLSKNACSLIIDYTSGTKAMSVGIALAANDYAPNTSKLSYVAGNYRDPNYGRVLTGSEIVSRKITPQAQYLQKTFPIAKKFFDTEDFKNAMIMFHSVSKNNPVGKEKELAKILERISKIYHHWHLWEFQDAEADFALLFSEEKGLRNEKLLKQKEIISILKILNNDRISLYDILHKNEKGVVEKLFLNYYRDAESHIKQDEFKRATIMLYRLIELIAQYKLAVEGIDTARVDKTILKKYNIEFANYSNNKYTSLGCFFSWILSKKLGYFAGIKINYKKLQKLLDMRNNLYLVHGKNTPYKTQIEELKQFVEQILEYVIPDWKSKIIDFRYLKLKDF
jgi:CRISPR-associated protein (TIGR02710 family)